MAEELKPLSNLVIIILAVIWCFWSSQICGAIKSLLEILKDKE